LSRKSSIALTASGRAINEKVRLYARIGQALLAAKEKGSDPFAAIERIVSWNDFARTVSEAEQRASRNDEDRRSEPDAVRSSPRLLWRAARGGSDELTDQDQNEDPDLEHAVAVRCGAGFVLTSLFFGH
jgi:ribosome-associated translation inhibitor RaiA